MPRNRPFAEGSPFDTMPPMNPAENSSGRPALSSISKYLPLFLATLISSIPAYNLAPPGEFFWPNFFVFWVPHAVVVGIFSLTRRPPISAIAGFSLGLTLFLLIVSVVPVEHAKEGVARLVLFLSGIPISFVASVLAVRAISKHTMLGNSRISLILLGCGLIGAISGTLGFVALTSL
jgi:hypothetical protein